MAGSVLLFSANLAPSRAVLALGLAYCRDRRTHPCPHRQTPGPVASRTLRSGVAGGLCGLGCAGLASTAVTPRAGLECRRATACHRWLARPGHPQPRP
jgi:hypothetical protein